jgi:hypothetical protein
MRDQQVLHPKNELCNKKILWEGSQFGLWYWSFTLLAALVDKRQKECAFWGFGFFSQIKQA